MIEPESFRLLMVEDNPGDADLARVYLEQVPGYSFELTVVPALRQAIEAVRAGEYDAVVLDLNLPDSQGVDTLKRFQNEHPDVPVVVVSGFGDEDLRREVMNEGAGDFVGKSEPVTSALARSIRYAVERHQARDRQRYMEMLVSANPYAVVVGDSAGVVQFANEAAEDLFGEPAEVLVGQHRSFLISDEQTSQLVIPRTDGARTAEVRVVEIEWHGSPAVLAALRDMTEQLRLGEQLRQAQKMEALGQLAGGIAHDFNNLLAAISGYGELLVASLEDRPILQADAMEMLNAAQRAGDLTRQLLTFSRRQPLAPERLNVNDVVEEMLRMLLRMVGDDVHIETHLSSEPLGIVADRGQLGQVVINLVVNARDAMPRGGTVTIETSLDTAREAGGQSVVRIRVADTGVGMDASTCSRIFEPFFTTKDPGRGTGLGLATAYGIVTQAGGTIDVESEPGMGTTFTITLPTAEPNAAANRPVDDRNTARAVTELVMLVEDEAGVREVTRRLLERHGYTVLDVQRPEEALAVSDETLAAVDLLLSDISMPGLSGVQMAQLLRGRRPDLAVLFMSGYGGERLQEQFGAREHRVLRKPFQSQELLSAVRAALDREDEHSAAS